VLVYAGPAACETDFYDKHDLSNGQYWPAPYAVICRATLPRNENWVDTLIVIARDASDRKAVDVCNKFASGANGSWTVNWLNNADGGAGVVLSALP
jgi:hypothetical protein